MYILLFVFLIVAFVAFVPGILFTLPMKSSHLHITIAHGVLFALVWTLLHKFSVSVASKLKIDIGGSMMEGLEEEEEEGEEENFEGEEEEEEEENV
jgi:hypothetical protein